MATANLIKGRKGGSGGGSSPTESPDDLQSNDIAKILVALGNGEWFGDLSGSNIYLDGTDIDSLGGNIKWEFRPGTQQQTYIQGMPSVENGITIDTEIKSNSNWVRAISNTQLDAVRLTFNWPALQEQKTNGDVVGYRIEYAIDLATDGGAFQQIISTAVDGKTTTTYQRSHRITLPKATTGWQVRIRRITANANSVRIADAMKLGMLTEVIDAKLRYPNTALLYVEFNAKQFPNRIPQISCKPKMAIIRVPDNYDPIARTYTGTWLGNFKWAWSNNPAWIFYDIVTSEMYGLGHRIDATQIDRYELYRIAQYCDQLVPDGRGGTGMEPRFLCDVYLQSQEEAWTVLTDLAGIFRGMTYWGDNQMVALADMPRDIDYTYTRASVINGKFTYSSGSERVRYSSAMVGYSNPINHYADDVEPVPEPDLVKRYGFNPLDITAIGCTRQSEANRRGRWALLSNAKDSVVTFNVSLDGHLSPPGRIIAVADPRRAGRAMGGRISEVSGRNITLDRVADVKPNDRLLLNLPSGKSQARTVQAVVGKVVTVTAAYSEVPEAQAVWAVDADDLFVQQYRVTSLTDNGDNTFTISAVFHDPDKYERIDTGARIEDRPMSVIPPGVQSPPTGIVISSFSSVSQGIAVTTMYAQWSAPDNAVAYEAQWRKDNGNWISIPRTSTASFDVTGIYAGRYLVRVRAINASDISSVWANSVETQLNGKEGKPPVPVGLKTTSINWGIQLEWGIPAGAEDTRNTEIQYSLTASGDNAILLTDVPYPQRQYTQLGLKAGQEFWYRARLVDRTGNESDWTDLVYGQASVDVSDITDAILEQIKDTEIFKDLIENAVESSEKLKELADAITDNAYQLADIVGSNKQTADAIISNSLAIADVVVRQTAQNGANSAKYEQLREVIATETDARVTDVIRLEAKAAQNAAGITEVRQAIATETEARASAVTQLTASTQVISSKADAANDKADNANRVGQQNTASITELSQVVTTLDSAMSSRLEELSVQAGVTNATVQNNAIAIIDHAVTQVNLRTTLNAQYGDNKSSIERIDNVIVSEKEATAQSLQQIRTDVAGNASSITNLSQTVSNYQQSTATQINTLNATVNGHTAAIAVNAQATANLNGELSAMYNVKIGIDKNGIQYAAGIGLGIENTPGGMQSQFIVLADRFAVMSQTGGAVSLPFFIENGQSFFNDAFFRNASIDFAKITDSLRSNDYVTGVAGWSIEKGGRAEFNNVVVRGTVFATDGNFAGTVYASKLVGDLADFAINLEERRSDQVGTGAGIDGVLCYVQQDTSNARKVSFVGGITSDDGGIGLPGYFFNAKITSGSVGTGSYIVIRAGNIEVARVYGDELNLRGLQFVIPAGNEKLPITYSIRNFKNGSARIDLVARYSVFVGRNATVISK